MTNPDANVGTVAGRRPRGFAISTRRKLSRSTPSLDSIRYYHFGFGEVSGIHCLIARTGYTGEDGFEIYLDPEQSEKLSG